MSKSCHFIFQNKIEINIHLNVNKHTFSLSINQILRKKNKYQQYFHCFIMCMLVPHPFWFSYQQNMVTISVAFKGAALIRGRRFFQCGYPRVRRLLEGGAYLRPGVYQRKCGICFTFSVLLDVVCEPEKCCVLTCF